MAKGAKKRAGLPELSRLELDVMDVVWELGDCSSAEVIERYGATKRELAPTTIRSVLANLRKKGYIKPIPTVERGFRLRATINRESVARRTLRGLVGSLFGGSPGEAIIHLLQEPDLDEAELERIRKLIDDKQGP